MSRITPKMVRAAYVRFLRHINGRQAANHSDVGGYMLDYAACYGGWRIEQIMNESGGITEVFGYSRRSSREMHGALTFASMALEATR